MINKFFVQPVRNASFRSAFSKLKRKKKNQGIVSLRYPNDLPTRQQLKDSLSEDFDVVIIGGGASGAGCALDAVTRGLKTALIEMDDFASGTSSKSTQLIHGGVRYLQQAIMKFDREQFNMVREALQERSQMIKNAPHLTRALPILLPVYKTWKLPYFWSGIKMYDSLAGRRNVHSSYVLGRKKTLAAFPMIKPDGLAGAIVYYDGQHDDARMNLAIILTAVRYGVSVLNHTKVTGFIKDEKGILKGVTIEDEFDGTSCAINTKCVINCTGPMTDTIRQLDDPNVKSIVKPSSGVHVILPGYYCSKTMGLLDAETTDDRVVFLLPWNHRVIAGTTDTACEVIHHPKATEKEIQFILSEIQKFYNEDMVVRRSDVLSAYSGIRPLVSDPKAVNTKSLVRNHLIDVSESGLVTLAGGKWTTYRKMAEEAIDTAVKKCGLNPQHKKCQTRKLLLEGGEGWTPTLYLRLIQDFNLDYELAKHLAKSYGTNSCTISKMAVQEEAGPVIIHPAFKHIITEIRYGIQTYACTVVDLIARRLRLTYLDAKAAQEALPLVVDVMAKELKWTDDYKQKQMKEATNYIQNDMGGSLRVEKEKYKIPSEE